jgi:hypothetical protein
MRDRQLLSDLTLELGTADHQRIDRTAVGIKRRLLPGCSKLTVDRHPKRRGSNSGGTVSLNCH